MKSIILLLFSFLILNPIVAQQENKKIKKVTDRFEELYNENNSKEIFAMFSASMQNFLPLYKTTEFISSNRQALGQIIRRDFLKYKNGFAVYKGYFENGLFDILISIDTASKIDGLALRPFQPDGIPILIRNKTELTLPFKGEWTVFWGGDTKELNYHVINRAQKNAFDFVVTDSTGKSYKTDGKRNEDYYAFGKEIIAPCDGEIVLVVEGVKDNILGEMNSFDVGGNTVILRTKNNEYLVFCHLKHHSTKVSEGQMITKGTLIGLCGNSGHSSEPHLHFHIQNAENMNVAIGVKCYFDHLIVNGVEKNDYSPLRNEKIKED